MRTFWSAGCAAVMSWACSSVFCSQLQAHQYIDTLCDHPLQLFTELAKAYTDALEPESPLPRQQPTSVLASMIRIMDALLPIVSDPHHGPTAAHF